jgi:hypothetical protein
MTPTFGSVSSIVVLSVGTSVLETEGARVGILETCDFRMDARQGVEPHEGHRSRAGLRRSWDGEPCRGLQAYGRCRDFGPD